MPSRDAIDRPKQIRPCAVAGRFYPSDPAVLQQDVDHYVQPDRPGPDFDRPIKAIIAPHAGYIYSAPIAGSAYRCVVDLRGKIRRVVLIGPAHYVAFSGLAVSSADIFETPLGNIAVDTECVHKLVDSQIVNIHDEAHAPEHGLEVHLPFLIHCLADRNSGVDFSLVPLLFGDVSYEHTSDVLDPFLDEPQTLIVVSSDLSHYHDYESARRLDRETADAILAGRGDVITSSRACGHNAIRGLLSCVNSRGLRVTELDLRNSGDTAGPRDRVVGYGAFAIH